MILITRLVRLELKALRAHLDGVGPWSDVLQDARGSELVRVLQRGKLFQVLRPTRKLVQNHHQFCPF